jgi:hypothetical protein
MGTKSLSESPLQRQLAARAAIERTHDHDQAVAVDPE